MFGDTFQGGAAVDILVAQGNVAVPTSIKSNSRCQLTRSYERDVKGNVFILTSKTGSVPCLNIPSEKSASLKIVQSILCLQLNISQSSELTVDVTIFDQANSKRRLSFATAHKVSAITPLHTKLPLKNVPRNSWFMINIDLLTLTSGLYPGHSFKFLDSLTVSSKCKVRRIFTVRDVNCASDLPKAAEFPFGVKYETKLINFECYEGILLSSQRIIHSAPKKLNQSANNIKAVAPNKELIKSEAIKNGSFESLVSSHGSEELNISGRHGISSAPVGKRPNHCSVNPQPPAPSKSGKSSSRIRARVYSNEKEPKPSASPDNASKVPEAPVPEPPVSDHGLFTFSSMPRVAPVPESPSVKPVSPFEANNVVQSAKDTYSPAKEGKSVPQISKKFSDAFKLQSGENERNKRNVHLADDGLDDEKENMVEKERESGEITARTNVHTPSDYDWRNYAPPDTGRSASSVEQSMLNSILDPHYQDGDTDIHNPLSALEDLSMQSSKYNLSSRLDYLNSNKSTQLNAMARANNHNYDEASYQLPSLENFRLGRNNNAMRSSPPLILQSEQLEESEMENRERERESSNVNSEPDEELELIYDPDLNCYFDPVTNKYYELRT